MFNFWLTVNLHVSIPAFCCWEVSGLRASLSFTFGLKSGAFVHVANGEKSSVATSFFSLLTPIYNTITPISFHRFLVTKIKQCLFDFSFRAIKHWSRRLMFGAAKDYCY